MVTSKRVALPAAIARASHRARTAKQTKWDAPVWKHEDEPIPLVQQHGQPYMQREAIEGLASDYLTLPYRSPGLERLLVDMLWRWRALLIRRRDAEETLHSPTSGALPPPAAARPRQLFYRGILEFSNSWGTSVRRRQLARVRRHSSQLDSWCRAHPTRDRDCRLDLAPSICGGIKRPPGIRHAPC